MHGFVARLTERLRRLTPIFKDREELAASGDLSTGLKDALAATQFLIVIASPSSARSRW